MRLARDLLLAYEPGETPWSYCSRLGQRMGTGGHIFAQHCETSLKALSAGDDDALSRLAAVTQMDVALLRAAAPITIGWNRTLMFGEVLGVWHHSRREDIRFCPVCLYEQDGSLGRYLLTEWLVTPVSVCRRHNVELRVVKVPGKALDPAPRLEEVARGTDRQRFPTRYPRALELHWFARMDGSSEDSWVSRMPFHALVSLSLAIGAERGGEIRTSIKGLAYEEWHDTACSGFEILEGESETILEYLRAKDALLRVDAKYPSPQNAYGELYKFLSNNLKETPYDRFREIMAKHIAENYEAQATSYGQPIVPAKLRSIAALAEAEGIDAQRIRLLVSTEQYLTERPKGLRGRGVISPVAAGVIVSSLRDGCTEPQLRKLLGARPPQVRALIDLGLIPPVGWRKNRRLYSRSAAARILAKILFQLDERPPPIGECLLPATGAPIQAIVTDGELLQLILGKKLKFLGTSRGNGRVASLLVSKAELIEVTGEEGRGLTLVQIAKRIRIRAALWSELREAGYAPDPNILTPRGVRLTAAVAVKEFERRYISLGETSKRLGVRPQVARAWLQRELVRPLPLLSHRHCIFERSDVEAALARLS